MGVVDAGAGAGAEEVLVRIWGHAEIVVIMMVGSEVSVAAVSSEVGSRAVAVAG